MGLRLVRPALARGYNSTASRVLRFTVKRTSPFSPRLARAFVEKHGNGPEFIRSFCRLYSSCFEVPTSRCATAVHCGMLLCRSLSARSTLAGARPMHHARHPNRDRAPLANTRSSLNNQTFRLTKLQHPTQEGMVRIRILRRLRRSWIPRCPQLCRLAPALDVLPRAPPQASRATSAFGLKVIRWDQCEREEL